MSEFPLIESCAYGPRHLARVACFGVFESCCLLNPGLKYLLILLRVNAYDV